MLFYFLAFLTVCLAMATVLSRSVLRSAVFLMGVLTCSAGFYLMLGAEFLAGVQVLVYVGGVVVLLVFAVMLTRSQDLVLDHPTFRTRLFGVLGASIFFATSCSLLLSTDRFRHVQATIEAPMTQTAVIGRALLSMNSNGYVLPFEVISILLLAVLIGGIVVARTDTNTKTGGET